MSRGPAPAEAAAGSFLAYLDARGDWIAAIAGGLLAAAFAPISAWPLAIACPALLMLSWRTATPRVAARRGFLFTAATFLAGTYWLYHSIHLIGQAPVWIALFLMFGMVSIMGAYTALFGWAAIRYGPPAGPLRHMVVVPAGLVLVEWLRGWLFSGFPWLALGYTQLDTGLAAWAPVGGVYAVGLAVAVLAGALATLVAGGRVARAIASVVVIVLCVASYLLGGIEWTRPLPRTVTVALVQGAVPQTMKWAPGQLDRIGNDHLDRVLGAAARMNSMIDALLALAQLSSRPLSRQPVNLSQLAAYVVEDLRRQAPERTVAVHVEAGLLAQGDPTLLRVVLENLLGNAWKYSARSRNAQIWLERGRHAGHEVFTVRDNGAGFDMRFADRLFGVFQRLHSASDFPGTGIGLATVRRIITRHGGEIWAESVVDRGSSFHFTVPAGERAA